MEPSSCCKIASFPVVLGMALVTEIVLFAHRSIGDPDIWWHLRNAETLVRNGQFVRADSYSYTVTGTPWINHEWLGEIPYYAVWSCCGLLGLYLVMLAALIVIFLSLYRLAWMSSGDYKAAALATGLAIPLATISFGPRTLLLGWILLLAELWILQRDRAGRSGSLWLLPPLFAIWINTHGSWLIGMVLLGVYAACGCCNFSVGQLAAVRRTPADLRRLAAVLVTSIAALFLNPYGWRLVVYPFDLAFRQKLNVSHVSEWESPDFHSLRGKLLLAMFLSLLVLALVRRRKWMLDELLFVLLGFYAAITYSRFLFLAAILVTPMLAVEIAGIKPASVARDKPVLNLAAVFAMACLIFARVPSSGWLAEQVASEYPSQAVAYLDSFHPRGKVLNDYDWGGFLIWHTRRIPVFVDSRVDIFEYRGVFADYLDIMGLKNSQGLMKKYDIRYVLYAREKPLASLLRDSPEWKILYEDGTAVLFERRGWN